MISIEYFFILSGLLFFIGVFGFITRRNLVAMLISVELVLNAVDLNFAAFNRLLFPAGQEGMIFTLSPSASRQRRAPWLWLLSSMFTVISTAIR